MLKFKNSTTGNQTPYTLHVEQGHGKFLFCFNSSLNSCRNLHSLNFIGRLLLKTLAINQWPGTANAFDESSVYYPKLRVHHM